MEQNFSPTFGWVWRSEHETEQWEEQVEGGKMVERIPSPMVEGIGLENALFGRPLFFKIYLHNKA